MKNFKDLAIQTPVQNFAGDKITMKKVLNRKIIIHDYKIEDTKFDKQKGCGKCLTLSIAVGENKHVLFTGATALIAVIKQVQKQDMPFATTIVEENDRYEFT